MKKHTEKKKGELTVTSGDQFWVTKLYTKVDPINLHLHATVELNERPQIEMNLRQLL
jgi:hypothetical protein